MSAPAAPRKVNPIVKALVVLHALLILSWTLPRAAPAVANGTIPPTPENVLQAPVDFALAANDRFKADSPTRHYLMSTGLWQYWDMFAPNPADTDIWFDAIVTHRSGKTAVQPYPRMKSLSIPEKYVRERYRKFMERINRDGVDDWKRPQFAQRMALLATRDPADPVVRVVLRRHFRTVKGPAKPVPRDYTTVEFFTWVVDQSQLRRDLGR